MSELRPAVVGVGEAVRAGGQASPTQPGSLQAPPPRTVPELSWAASPAQHLEDFTELFMNISHYILDVIILLRIN